MEAEEAIVVIISSMGIMAGVAVMWMAVQSRRQIREMEHRERLAMIERGIVPSPEVDPGGFERTFSPTLVATSPGATRARSAGVIMISLGLAFTFIVSFAGGEPGVGLGIGGAFAIVGGGFLVNSYLISRTDAYTAPRVPSHISHVNHVEPRRPEPPH